MAERFGTGFLRSTLGACTLVFAFSAAAHAQAFEKSNGKLATRDATKKVFVLETLNAGLCQSQPKPTLTIFPDGRQEFSASVRSTSPKNTYQAYVRYYNAAGSFLTEVKWWQYMMEQPNRWTPWKINAKADPNVAKKYKDIRQVSLNYKCTG